jgi:predicted dehydrogenase
MRVGIIGCGALGRVHAERFAGMEGVRVAVVSDPVVESAESVRRDLGLEAEVFSDYRPLLEAGLDAVCIASPDRLHVGQVLDALAAGLHVLCEKPLTHLPGELQAVIDAAAGAGRHVSMTYPRRYDAGIRRLREEILSGRWGSVNFVTTYNSEDWITPNAGTWRHDPELCPGGFFHDASGHQIDTLLWATGLRGERVRATVDNLRYPVPLRVHGEAVLTGGVPMTFTFHGGANAWREYCSIHCERMDFYLQQGRAYWTPDGNPQPVPADGPEETADAAFVRLVRGDGPNWAPPGALWPVLTFSRAALEAGATGKETTL